MHESRGAMTVLAQTLQLAFRIALVWAAGFLIAVVVRSVLPEKVEIPLGRGALVFPFSRLGFWTCLLAALTVTGMIVIRAMIVDIRSVR
jgi:zinc transporter ZupT